MRKNKPTIDDKNSIFSHLTELRRRLIIVISILILGTILIYSKSTILVGFLKEPIREFNLTLAFFSVTQAFITRLKISLIATIVIASPILLYQLLAFIWPGLVKREQKLLYRLILSFTLPFIAGVIFTFKYTFPFVISYLIRYGKSYMTPVFSGEDYFAFAAMFCLLGGLTCVFPFLIITLAKIGVINYPMLKKSRKFIILGLLLGEFLIIPVTDLSSLLVIVLPIYVLYEVSIVIVKIMEKRKSKKQLGNVLESDEEILREDT